jgi:hypothetical protein
LVVQISFLLNKRRNKRDRNKRHLIITVRNEQISSGEEHFLNNLTSISKKSRDETTFLTTCFSAHFNRSFKVTTAPSDSFFPTLRLPDSLLIAPAAAAAPDG